MKKKRVLLGFSGGIDSCASAIWLTERGYSVTALTLDTIGDSAMLENAQSAATQLGIKWRAEDVRQRFSREIIDYFVSEYTRGATPSPCVVCNPRIKWAALNEIAVSEGYDHIATGHYFRIVSHENRLYVARAADPSKDQSYYLWGLNQEVLSRALTPMGDQIKEAVKQQMPDSMSPRESMGICFLRGQSYGEWLRDHSGRSICEGDVIDGSGKIVGRHRGYQLYTIGQRKGFVAPSDKLDNGMAVKAIDAMNNRVVVGQDIELWHNDFFVNNVVAANPDEFSCIDIKIIVRGIGRNPEGYAHITPMLSGRLHVQLDNPAWAAAEGQPVVFYRDDRVIGGGFLSRTNI